MKRNNKSHLSATDDRDYPANPARRLFYIARLQTGFVGRRQRWLACFHQINECFLFFASPSTSRALPLPSWAAHGLRCCRLRCGGSMIVPPPQPLRLSSILPPEGRTLVCQRLVNEQGLFCARMLYLMQKATIGGARMDVAVSLYLCAQACRRIYQLRAAWVKIHCRG